MSALPDSLQLRSLEANINALSSRPVLPLEAEEDEIDEPEDSFVADTFNAAKKLKDDTGHLGTSISSHYEPRQLLINPPSPSDITLELLMASQAHLGHSTKLWNPANQRYIFGIREGIHIISLEVTAAYLRRACKIVTAVSHRGGLVLFVGTRPGQADCIVNAAKLAGGCHLFERWTPGGITNGQQILGHCKMKVVDEKDEEITGYEDTLRNRAVLKPDLVVVMNPLENYILLHECGLAGIPTIGIVDTDVDPTWVTYPIPANDDSLRCVQTIAGILGKAGEEGQRTRKEAAKAGKVTYVPETSLGPPARPDDVAGDDLDFLDQLEDEKLEAQAAHL
ncbi:MAG: hypothetical protein M1825_001529 [Sarcosagium campestre]|nr:MAG: hypothetical protein M1825_001529 [Sarcosagium campestre]